MEDWLYNIHDYIRSLFLIIHVLLDDLDFFNQEGSDDSVLDSLAAEMSSIGSANSPLSLADQLELVSSHHLKTVQFLFTASFSTDSDGSSLLHVLSNHSASGSLGLSDLVGSGVETVLSPVSHSGNHSFRLEYLYIPISYMFILTQISLLSTSQSALDHS